MRVILLFFLLAQLHVAHGQATERRDAFEKVEYLKKSKRQKTLSLIAGGLGLGLFTVGTIMNMSEFGNGLSGGSGYKEKTSQTGEALMYVGGGLVLVSLPFHMAYRKDKKLAATISVNNIRVIDPQLDHNAFVFVPSLCLNICFGKKAAAKRIKGPATGR